MIYNRPRKKKKTPLIWTINEAPNLTAFSDYVDFSSGGVDLYYIEITSKYIRYRDFAQDFYVYTTSGGWVMGQVYRTITFLMPPTGTLLEWLKLNAIPQ